MKTKNSVDWVDSAGVSKNIDAELAAIDNGIITINTELESKVAKQFTDSAGAVNYIGGDVGTLTISEGTHIFTNCTGSVTLSGNTANLYSNSSPGLAVLGKTNDNYQNIFENGIASNLDNTIILYENGVMVEEFATPYETVTLSQLSGDIYYGKFSNVVFPRDFNSDPIVHVTGNSTSAGTWIVSAVGRIGVSGIDSIFIQTNSTDTVFCRINIRAIGRWKA